MTMMVGRRPHEEADQVVDEAADADACHLDGGEVGCPPNRPMIGVTISFTSESDRAKYAPMLTPTARSGRCHGQ
jgi:hypothetical protein